MLLIYPSSLCVLCPDSTPRHSSPASSMPSSHPSPKSKSKSKSPKDEEGHFPMRLFGKYKRSCLTCKILDKRLPGKMRGKNERAEYQKSNIGCPPCKAVFCSHNCWKIKHTQFPAIHDDIPPHLFTSMSKRHFTGKDNTEG